MGNPFRLSTLPLVNQPERPPTKDEMAAELAEDTCLRIKEFRAEALRREQECEPPMETTPEHTECYETLDALMKGQHRWVVVPVILEHFPEFIEMAKAKPTSLIAP